MLYGRSTGMDAERAEGDTRLHFTGGTPTVFIVMRQQRNSSRKTALYRLWIVMTANPGDINV